MRADPILVKRITRATAFALAGVAIVVAAVRIDRSEPTPSPRPVAPVVDPLGAELERCRKIARPEDVDDACRAAWAEIRRRFFAPDPAGEARP